MNLKKSTWKAYGFWILLTESAGALSGRLTREGTKLYISSMRKPPLSPPSLVFPIVWSVLFTLMGVGAARIWLSSPSDARRRGLWVYLIQLTVNFFWSILFFDLQAFGLSLLWLGLLWVLVFLMIRVFRPIDKTAAWLQLPYLLWISFAAYLNFGVWRLN